MLSLCLIKLVFPTDMSLTTESRCSYWEEVKTFLTFKKRSIKGGLFHFGSCCDLLHTAWQPTVNKDFHNPVWPFPISSTTGPWRKLQGAQEELLRLPLRYHQSPGLEADCVVVLWLQLVFVLNLIWTGLCKQKRCNIKDVSAQHNIIIKEEVQEILILAVLVR